MNAIRACCVAPHALVCHHRRNAAKIRARLRGPRVPPPPRWCGTKKQPLAVLRTAAPHHPRAQHTCCSSSPLERV
ncbi:hypothetical protein EON67_06755 [archaeon]|nr:MAG: hypothetical protein EON67_06755 [archaeon]